MGVTSMWCYAKKLRDEQRFASLDALKQQIANDVVAARNYLLQRSESCI